MPRSSSLVLAGLLVAGAAGAHAEPVSRYTSIANKDCVFDRIGRGAGDDEVQTKTCPGLAGVKVRVASLGTRVRVGLQWRNKITRKPVDIWVTEAWSAGMNVEWRGHAAAKGGFAPDAMIVRMIFPKEDTNEYGDQVLVAIRLDGTTACIMGAVDARANASPNELARRLADRAPQFQCGRDQPTAGGQATQAVTAILARQITD